MKLSGHKNSALLAIASQWWFSLRWVVITLSVMFAGALAGSFIPYESVIAEGHPWLPQKICSGCAFCGMTRSFCAMSAGRWAEASDWNPLGPLFYALCWLWVMACLLFVAKKAYNKLKPKAGTGHEITPSQR